MAVVNIGDTDENADWIRESPEYQEEKGILAQVAVDLNIAAKEVKRLLIRFNFFNDRKKGKQ